MKYVVQYKYEKLIEVTVGAPCEDEAIARGLVRAKIEVGKIDDRLDPNLTFNDIWEC